MKKLLFLLLLVVSHTVICAQEVPRWVIKKPRPANDTYLYVIERGVGVTEMEARNRAMGLVYRNTIERLSLAIELTSINDAIAKGSNYGDTSEGINVPINKVCEYIQQENNQYAVYVLCQVALNAQIPTLFTDFNQCNQAVKDQDPIPSWCNDTWRATNYPHNKYVQALVRGTTQTGESVEQTHIRLKRKAQAEILQHIITTQKTIKDIPNLSLESWHNQKTNEIYAFAWVQRQELTHAWEKQIIGYITRAEIALEEAQELINEGEKITARKSITKALQYLQQIEELQTAVQHVDANVAMEDIAFAESNQLTQRARALSLQVKNGTSLYIGGHVTTFDDAYPNLIQQIKQEIAHIGCTFAAQEAEAEWVIRLQGATVDSYISKIQDYTTYVVIVEVDVEIIKKGHCIYAGKASNKGVHTNNHTAAAHTAFEDAGKEIAAKINEIINK